MIVEPYCERCSVPFSHISFGGAQKICVSCQTKPPLWRSARAAFVYNDWSRKIIFLFKYYGHTEYADFIGQRMIQAGNNILKKADLLVPVPMYVGKLRKRKFNQAALLAHYVSRKTSIPVIPDGLQRIRETRALASLSGEQRAEEIKNVIKVREKRRNHFKGKSIILVDDVLTTGVTASVCVKELLEAGALSVDILVAARTNSENNLYNNE
ncbi:ComF family protein [Swingsia samuiensis]|uniref:ComF family protein n=2 Tax=Swingsia samuiensis TaxID=1293412 RepID=A0A4Y6UPE7_9PROT|nr:ComF family protein [Swingsia samuiensis]